MGEDVDSDVTDGEELGLSKCMFFFVTVELVDL